MDLLLVGSGGREHALLKALLKSRDVNRVYVLPGNAAMEGSRVKRVPIQPKQITEIAAKHLITVQERGDLETRHCDSEDFIEVSVWGLEAALKDAYEAGRKSK